MAKRKITWELYSYGIYSRWNKASKKLPKLIEITTRIPIEPDTEYGYVLKIKGAKGKQLDFCIDHPPMRDEHNNLMPPFDGSVIINSNDYEFFLGDTVWEPYEQMEGEWNLSTTLDRETIAKKTLQLYLNKQPLVKNV